jgi:hypothetical protein
MSRRIVPIAVSLVLVAWVCAESQPPPLLAVDRAIIRVSAGGNELRALREAPVAYASLEQIVTDIARPAVSHAAPVTIVRASPPEEIDYLLCVTSSGTLIVGERFHTLGADGPRRVFTRGEIARSYPSVSVADGWLWLVDVPLSREVRVTLQLRAPARWPLESLAVTTDFAQ